MSPNTEAPSLQGEAFSYLVEPVGVSVQLDCVVHGMPAPAIRWAKDGLPLWGGRQRYRLHNGSLTIRRTEARQGPGWGLLPTALGPPQVVTAPVDVWSMTSLH